MTRDDPELGPVRRCRSCKEFWPDDVEFYDPRYRICRACQKDRANGRPIPVRPETHAAKGVDLENRRKRDNARKAALRRDPILGDKLRAREREAQRRYYERNRAVEIERSRAYYAARLDRPVRIGFGRPRVAA
jgi:hypothetical protein